MTTKVIKGCEEMLTPEEVATLIKRPVRYVIRQLIKSGVLQAKKTSAREYRIRPVDFRRWQEPK